MQDFFCETDAIAEIKDKVIGLSRREWHFWI